MLTGLFSSRCSAGRSRSTAFTLIELLTVMAIIVVLAGLFIGVASYAQSKAARQRATVEIQGLTTAITSYEVDNGAIPSNQYSDKLGTTKCVIAESGSSGITPESDAYKMSSKLLFRALSGYYYADGKTTDGFTLWKAADARGDTNIPQNRPKSYLNFSPGQLPSTLVFTNGVVNEPDKVTAVLDPFGNSYGYSTINAAAQTAASTSSDLKGINPTYDLWSTAGYSKSKPYPADMIGKDVSSLWITNWSAQR